jgi:hypothetical protein
VTSLRRTFPSRPPSPQTWRVVTMTVCGVVLAAGAIAWLRRWNRGRAGTVPALDVESADSSNLVELRHRIAALVRQSTHTSDRAALARQAEELAELFEVHTRETYRSVQYFEETCLKVAHECILTLPSRRTLRLSSPACIVASVVFSRAATFMRFPFSAGPRLTLGRKIQYSFLREAQKAPC